MRGYHKERGEHKIAYLSRVFYNGTGATKNYSFPFPYISKEHITAYINGIQTAFTWLNTGTVTFSNPPAAGTIISIIRTTPRDISLVDYNDGSILSERELDLSALQLLYLIQEAIDITADVIFYDPMLGVFDAKGRRIVNVGTPQSVQDALTLGYFDTTILPALQAKIDTYLTNLNIPDLPKYQEYFRTFEKYINDTNELLIKLDNISNGIENDIIDKYEKLTEYISTLSIMKEEVTYLVNSINELIHKGHWQDGGIYKPQNIVEMNGSSYVLRRGDGLVPPPHADWLLVAKAGQEYFLDTIDGGRADTEAHRDIDCGTASTD